MTQNPEVYAAGSAWVDAVMAHFNGVYCLTPALLPVQENEDPSARMIRTCFQDQENRAAERRFREAECMYLRAKIGLPSFKVTAPLLHFFIEGEKYELMHIINVRYGNEKTQALLDGLLTDIDSDDSNEGTN
jgi:hypothetical protein